MAHANQPARHISFTRAELKAFTGATLPDLIAEGVRLLFVGINPGLRSVGVGITSLVARATASAGELGPAELAEGARALAGNVRRFRPRVVAILGVTAYRTAFGYPRAVLGRQQEDLYGAQLWVVPNPSGRNAHAPLATLATAYREVALAAAIDLGAIDLRAPG